MLVYVKLALTAVGIVVRDMDEALRFYRTLGLDIPEQAPGEGHVGIELPNGVSLMWDTIELMKEIDPNWEPKAGSNVAIGFELPTPQAVDELFARVKAAGFGHKYEPWDAFWGQRYAVLADPDGNAVDLYAALPSAGG